VNWDRAVLAAEQFELSTGIACRVIDDTGRTVTSGEKIADESCRFCLAYQEITGKSVDCRRVHLYGGTQAFRFGGRYTYTCPLSMVHFTSPILDNGKMTGVLVAGPVLLIEHSEFLSDELPRLLDVSSLKTDELEKIVFSLPRISTERARALSDVLLYTATWITGWDARTLADTETRVSQMARIAERIQQLKVEEQGLGRLNYPIEKEKALLRSIAHGDREESASLLNDLLGSMYFTTGSDLNSMKIMTRELIVLLSRAALDGGADPETVFGLNLKSHDDIAKFTTVDQLSHWLGGMLQKYVSYVFDVQAVKHRDIILKAMSYIRKNFTEKITLEEVAAEVSLSPTYFSRIFKEEAGQSFKSFLNNLRITEAKNMLRETDITLIEIASQVGFEDQSYFSRVFRNIVGVSPGRYRRTAYGRLPETGFEIHE